MDVALPCPQLPEGVQKALPVGRADGEASAPVHLSGARRLIDVLYVGVTVRRGEVGADGRTRFRLAAEAGTRV